MNRKQRKKKNARRKAHSAGAGSTGGAPVVRIEGHAPSVGAHGVTDSGWHGPMIEADSIEHLDVENVREVAGEPGRGGKITMERLALPRNNNIFGLEASQPPPAGTESSATSAAEKPRGKSTARIPEKPWEREERK